MFHSIVNKTGALVIMLCLASPLFADANDNLIESIRKKNMKGVQSALANGAEANKACDKMGVSALNIAAYTGNTEIMKLLIDKKAKIDEFDGMQQTPLMSAAEGGNLEAVKLLLEKKAKAKNKAKDGTTVLMYAAKGGNPAVVKLIAEKGAEVNAQDRGGWSALMHAAESNRAEAVKELINLKADLNLKSSISFSRGTKEYYAKFYPGYTALSIARATGRKEVAKILEDAGAISYTEELFDNNDLYKKLGLYEVALGAASKSDFNGIIDILIKSTPEGEKREESIKVLKALKYAAGAWYVARITYAKKPPKGAIGISMQDKNGKPMARQFFSYLETSRSGNVITKYREVILIETAVPLNRKNIAPDRSPVTLTVTLFKKNRKIMRFYTDRG